MRDQNADCRVSGEQAQNRAITTEFVSVLRDIGEDFAIRYNESLTTHQAAEFLKVGRHELLHYVKAGLPCYQMGKGFRFTVPDLISFRERFRSVFGHELKHTRLRIDDRMNSPRPLSSTHHQDQAQRQLSRGQR